MDIVITFDTTGSMYPCLSEARRRIADTVNSLFKEYADLRIGIIAHGDYCDAGSRYVTKHFQLSDNPRDIVEFVNSVSPTGGGDSDECYELVLKEAHEFNWRSHGKKILIMVGDADPHRVGYKYAGITHNIDWRVEAKKLADSDILVYPVKCLNYSTTSFWTELAKIGNGVALTLHQFNNILEIIRALVYKADSNDRVEVYRAELETTGQLNRNLAQIIDSLLGKTPTARVTEHEGLREVDPTRFQVLHVDTRQSIKGFVEGNEIKYRVGRGFYELTKREEVQERKEIILQNKNGDFFSGKAARELLGLPFGTRGMLTPYDVPDGFTAYVQSTSVNRVLMPGTRFLYET